MKASRARARMAEQSQQLAGQIAPLLAGKDPAVIGAALADLMAKLLAGHFARDGDTAALREEMLSEYVVLIRNLIEPNEKIMLGRMKGGEA